MVEILKLIDLVAYLVILGMATAGVIAMLGQKVSDYSYNRRQKKENKTKTSVS